MITVKAETKGDDFRLSVRGHAGYKETDDPVCAACSALVHALWLWMDNNPLHVKRIGCLTRQKDMTAGSGKAEMEVSGGEGLRAAFMTALLGLAAVSLSYPNCVEVYINGEKAGEY